MKRSLIQLFPILILSFFANADQKAKEYDGHWWDSIYKEEQDGFISGYLDCCIYDAKIQNAPNGPIVEIIRRIDQYYRSKSAIQEKPVVEVLKQINRGPSNTAGQDRKKKARERHGSYDGDYWRQSSHAARTGFVQGYILCRSKYLNEKFPMQVENYVKAISQWYGVSDTDESEMNVKTADDKVGDVLIKLKK